MCTFGYVLMFWDYGFIDACRVLPSFFRTLFNSAISRRLADRLFVSSDILGGCVVDWGITSLTASFRALAMAPAPEFMLSRIVATRSANLFSNCSTNSFTSVARSSRHLRYLLHSTRRFLSVFKSKCMLARTNLWSLLALILLMIDTSCSALFRFVRIHLVFCAWRYPGPSPSLFFLFSEWICLQCRVRVMSPIRLTKYHVYCGTLSCNTYFCVKISNDKFEMYSSISSSVEFDVDAFAWISFTFQSFSLTVDTKFLISEILLFLIKNPTP